MAHVMEGKYAGGSPFSFGVVVSRFNELVTKTMLEGALNELRRLGVSEAAIHVVWVPGAYEIPLACKTLSQSQTLDGLIALGCVIRGETSHYEHVAQSVCDGLQKVALERLIPVGYGVLTVENMAQALDRAGGKQGNKGRDAARSAFEMAALAAELHEGKEKEEKLKEFLEREFKT
ncbi:MAG: 6,7-dimethyl-8-ribityllumazine synthase [Candidatus Omnitrophica bacterium]|nr:6,7-dimethyl-8-ribityllumazine synthase [Candidatus Omnitrophota bacterium]